MPDTTYAIPSRVYTHVLMSTSDGYNFEDVTNRSTNAAMRQKVGYYEQ